MKKLKTKYKLAIISNIDDDLLAHSLRLMGVPFDFLITAQQAGSYPIHLVASDGALSASADITLTISHGTLPPTVTPIPNILGMACLGR